MAQAADPHTTVLDTVKIEPPSGAKGKLDVIENVFKVTAPRNDLSVTVAGVKLMAATGLTSWGAFSPAGDKVMVMEDRVYGVADVNLAAVIQCGL